MFRKTKQRVSFGLAILGLLFIIAGTIIVLFVNPKKTMPHELSIVVTHPTSPDQFLTHTVMNSNFQLSDYSNTSFLNYNDFLISSPHTWKYDYYTNDTSILEMLNNNMVPTFTFSQFALQWHDRNLSLLCSSPDGYSRLSSALINTENAAMTIVPKPTDLSILYLPERQVQANVSQVGKSLTLSEDNQRLYVSYYVTDHMESRVYHKDQTSADFPSGLYLQNLMRIQCGAISMFNWDDSSQSWIFRSTLQHPFGGRYDSMTTHDGYGDQLHSWTLRNYVAQTDTYMLTTTSHNHSSLITYKDDDTLYHYQKLSTTGNTFQAKNATWLFSAQGSSIKVYQWDHQLVTLTLFQTITTSTPNRPFTFANDLLFIYNEIYAYSNHQWRVTTTLSFNNIPMVSLHTDPLTQWLVAVSNVSSYVVFSISEPKKPLMRSNLPEAAPLHTRIQIISPTRFLIFHSYSTQFLCDVYTSNSD
jgi:hypothetical protein